MSSESFAKRFEQEKKALDERLAGKHIRALAFLQETSTENDRLRHQVSELEGYKIKADYYAALEQQVHSLQEELSKCAKLHSLGRNVEEKIEAVKEQYSKAFREYQEDIEDRYKKQVTRCIAEQKENARAWEEEKVKIKEREEEFKASNAELQRKLDAATAMEKDMNKLTEELHRTIASFQEIKAKNEELQQSKDNLQKLCKSFEEENISLQNELEDNSNSKQKLKKEMNKMVMKITKYIKQIREMEKVKNSASRLEFENSWVKHLHEKTAIELNSLKMKHKDALNELQVVTKERNRLRNEISAAQQEVVRLQDKLEGSKHSFAEFLELRRQVDILREENKSLLLKSRSYKIKLLKPDTKNSQKQLLPLKFKA